VKVDSSSVITEANINQYIPDIPVGIPMPWPQINPPAGYFECNGSQFDVNRFPKLAAAYTSGFLPDLRGEFIRGWDNARGVDPHRIILSFQNDAIRNITGSFTATDDNNARSTTGSFYVRGKYGTGSGGGSQEWLIGFDASRTVPVSHDNHPRNIAFMYIVKAE
ncbi:phage tail protein, partial [Candidatus Schmidhempelia bombi]|uniref:phage tail protein n=1 Tax=Candidatus Schmidhempelia bombi TaxID=1505866 RepID=UPI0023AB227C